MKRYILLLTVVLITSVASHAQTFKVIVNSQNSVTALSSSEASNFFLKKTAKWKSGEKIVPVDLKADSPIREAFTKNVHKKTVGAIKSYWQQYVFAGSGTPPIEKNNDAEIIEYVKKNVGAIGYISATADVSEVKVVTIN
jgi:ABC-type phosphate transport system substrate-binding protein